MASCTASSAMCRWAGPTSRAKCETMRPASRRKVCSSSASAAGVCSLPEELSDFDSAMFEVRVTERPFHCLLVIGGFDQIEASQDFFRFAIGAVRRPWFPADGAQHFAGILGEPLRGFYKLLFSPGS